MRINRIKLAGFKSFVDPTTLSLPGNLSGVVGPNGCGKSNIIDALIWVLGESSAKHLRGDSMVDVIFNGSNTRKPVGQATVEIVFDNSDGAIGGQYAGFGEISIKRTVTRDGVSAYFLNGARCRRKDITDVFLGTGVGARGYSVIAQGTISRVIEAKPEDLRGFLEEAAGISKYKERRRETENRMRHTGENMARLTDIRDELAKQLGHLQRQARSAERYQEFKAEERKVTARGLAVRWRTLDQDGQTCRQLAEQRSTELEAEIARLRAIEARQTTARDQQTEATDHFNRQQSEFYARSGEISRLEQAIKHAEERAQSLQQDRQEAQASLSELGHTLTSDSAQLAEVNTRADDLEPRFAGARAAEEQALEQVRTIEGELERWQQSWDAFNREHSALAQREHAAQIRLEHLRTSVDDARTRTAALNGDAKRNETGELVAQLEQLRAALEQGETEHRRTGESRAAVRANLAPTRAATHGLGGSLHEQQAKLEEQRGRLASLRALQEAAFGDDHVAVEAFCQSRGIDHRARLAAFIEVEAGWERALEAALRIPLGALCGPQLTARIGDADGFDPAAAGLTVIDDSTAAPAAARGDTTDLLAHKVRGPIDLVPLLRGIYTAPSAAAAATLRRRLAADEVIVLPDGTLLGAHWVQVAGTSSDNDSILARERAIAAATAAIAEYESTAAALRAEVDAAQARIKAMEQEDNELGAALDRAGQTLSRQRADAGRQEVELQRRQARAADVAAELDRLARLAATQQDALSELGEEQAAAKLALDQHAARRSELGDERNVVQARLDATRRQWREQHDSAHQIELGLEQARARRTTLNEALTRNAQARAVAGRRCMDIEAALASAEAPRAGMRDELEQALHNRLEAENRLTEARRRLNEIDAGLQEAAAARVTVEQTIGERQKRLEQTRLDLRALEVRLQELLSRFEPTGEDLGAILASLNPADDAASLQEELERVAARIGRLGPINLAAIDEYNQLAERKAYLDSQHADLTEALSTLQEAIRKIDRETRARFRETFDKVNNGLQAMFPVLFGGGHAYLELTGEDLLETGVTVMARPPGKRNSTIHLLSGGEKALTAIAFVFSIFELNPAPFCLLDEVDAPLDDNNVVRLIEMLRSMSRSVQFLFVTHNKITMEIAEQLIGVTMQEAGVSRLVAVNMQEAVELAATA